jgi:DNA-binding SARP family transcriptional activator
MKFVATYHQAAKFPENLMHTALQIYLLGSFRLIVDGVAVSNADWQKRKARLLIQILALQPSHELHREELMEMLFPDIDMKPAEANLHRVLYAARRALEPNRSSYASSKYLLVERRRIKLTAERNLWIDAEEFENYGREGLKTNDNAMLESAAEIYKGDLLAEEPFEEWAIDRRERLKTLFHRVLRQLAKNSEKQANIEEAHFWLDKILSHEPVDEAAHRAKMRLYEKQGESCLALKQYEKCREALFRNLGVAPDRETEKLRNQILSIKKGK